jgi:hypothetical protein
MRLAFQIPTLIGGGELIVFLIPVIVGIIVIMLLATVLHFIIPIRGTVFVVAIPGFPPESIIIGLLVGVLLLLRNSIRLENSFKIPR